MGHAKLTRGSRMHRRHARAHQIALHLFRTHKRLHHAKVQLKYHPTRGSAVYQVNLGPAELALSSKEYKRQENIVAKCDMLGFKGAKYTGAIVIDMFLNALLWDEFQPSPLMYNGDHT